VSCVIASPTASGKTVCFELAIVRLLTKTNGVQTQPSRKKVVYVAPIKALCHERAMDWTAKFTPLGLKCLELTGDSEDHTQYELTNADIMYVVPVFSVVFWT
jgi:ATP-dependent DNA helicase HFM1/MER3